MMHYQFPKAELHLHLDGSINPKLAYTLAKQLDLIQPQEDYAAFSHRMIVPEDVPDLATYLACFDLPLALLQHRKAIEECTYDLIKRLCDEGIVYAEIRFAPQYHLQKGLNQKDALEAVLEGVDKAKAEGLPIQIGIICCMMIDPVNDNDALNWTTLDLAYHYLDKGVVAIDLAGAEGAVPMDHYRPFFEKARSLNIPYTIHAGEAGGPDHVKSAIKMGAKRIGHGGNCIHDPSIVEMVRTNDVTLEMCPTSNVHCKNQPSYPNHPLKPLYQHGIKVTVSCDNRTLSDITLLDEYDHLIEDMGLTIKDIIQMNINAFNAAFGLTSSQKRYYIDQLNTLLSHG